MGKTEMKKIKKTHRARLAEFQEKYDRALSAYGAEREAFVRRREQYNGSAEIPGGKDAEVVWNFTMELIESQIDSSIPLPKVTPMKPDEKNKRLAAVVEDMIRNETDRLPFEYLNDEDERTVRICGGSAYLVEWDNTVKMPNAVGALSVRLLDPMEFVPQDGVYYLHYMDNIFLRFEDTKSRIERRYGVDVSDEAVDALTAENTNSDEMVTQVTCYYLNDRGGLGCFSWVGDTVLIDDDDYEARKDEICAECGKTRPLGEDVCACGCEKWEKRPSGYEELRADVVRSDGSVIPHVSPVMENGEAVMEEYEEPASDPLTGLPLMERVLDGGGMAIGSRPSMEAKRRKKMGYTKIPYYYPRRFPVALRKNVSVRGKLLGDSDCDVIRVQQLQANKLLTKAAKKQLAAGSYVTKPVGIGLALSDEDFKPIEVESPEQMSMLRSIPLQVDTSADIAMAKECYEQARSTLGITDSFQGKPDATAQSGVAKQALIAQSAGRQQSKQQMKNAAYAELYEIMFKFMLAYADEPRVYTSVNEEGEQVEQVFNRYDFLEQDENGEWYYNDAFLFSVDESGINQRNRQMVLTELKEDFASGAYGPQQDPKTLLRYWKMKEAVNAAGAKQMVHYFQQEVEKQEQAGGAGMPPGMGALQSPDGAQPQGTAPGGSGELPPDMQGLDGAAPQGGGEAGAGGMMQQPPAVSPEAAGGLTQGMPPDAGLDQLAIQDGVIDRQRIEEIASLLAGAGPEEAMTALADMRIPEEEKQAVAALLDMQAGR